MDSGGGWAIGLGTGTQACALLFALVAAEATVGALGGPQFSQGDGMVLG